MNNINSINSYSKLGSVNPTKPSASENGQAAPPQASQNGGKADQVEISPAARFLSQISQMPDIRFEKVEQIRQELADGSYDIDGKISQALDNMIEENF